MKIFDKIKNGLEETIAYENGTLNSKATKVTISSNQSFDYTKRR